MFVDYFRKGPGAILGSERAIAPRPRNFRLLSENSAFFTFCVKWRWTQACLNRSNITNIQVKALNLDFGSSPIVFWPPTENLHFLDYSIKYPTVEGILHARIGLVLSPSAVEILIFFVVLLVHEGLDVLLGGAEHHVVDVAFYSLEDDIMLLDDFRLEIYLERKGKVGIFGLKMVEKVPKRLPLTTYNWSLSNGAGLCLCPSQKQRLRQNIQPIRTLL